MPTISRTRTGWRDRPVSVPEPPLVAREDEAQGRVMAGQGEAGVEVVVLVAVEERLVHPQREGDARQQRDREHGRRPGRRRRPPQRSRPPSTPTTAPFTNEARSDA